MLEAGILLSGLLIVGALYGAYLVGRAVGADALKRAEATIVTERSVRHNLNCLVGDLKAALEEMTGKRDRLGKILTKEDDKLRQVRADAAAYNQSKGLWCTDQPELLRHHAKKERFFRLGYPEHKL